MDLFEKINRAFGSWYEGLFGGCEDIRPKDILRKILVALEEHRKEGFDNKIYVPNQYILEIAVEDEEEKEYLLSFLDRDELQQAIHRYCRQNNYHVRGTLDFTIKEVERSPEERRRDKIRVRCRYDSRLAAQKPTQTSIEARTAGIRPARMLDAEEEQPTIAAVHMRDESDLATVPAVATARLTIYPPGKPPYEVPIARQSLSIGRSARVGNDVVLSEDGQVSRRHARIEREIDGRFTLYDLDTTNGTRVNGRKIDNCTLSSGDEILIGATRMVFTQESSANAELALSKAPPPPHYGEVIERRARLILEDDTGNPEDFVLGSETWIGRGVTNDIVLADRSIATRHIRILRGTPWKIEVLDAHHPARLNGTPLQPGEPAPLRSGDRIHIGQMCFRFEEEEQ